MRGEYLYLPVAIGPPPGSPPHAWGIQTVDTDALQDDRITPTCVGNTPFYMQGNKRK